MPRKSLKLNLPKEKRFTGVAPVWKRFFAFIIDLLIIDFVIIFPFRNIILKIIPVGIPYSQAYDFLIGNPGFTRLISIITITISIFAILYFSILELKLNQTVGKIFMNIYVISESKKFRYWQALIRSLFFLPIFPFILLWVIDPIVLFFNKNNQRLSEILSKTRTIQNYTIQP